MHRFTFRLDTEPSHTVRRVANMLHFARPAILAVLGRRASKTNMGFAPVYNAARSYILLWDQPAHLGLGLHFIDVAAEISRNGLFRSALAKQLLEVRRVHGAPRRAGIDVWLAFRRLLTHTQHARNIGASCRSWKGDAERFGSLASIWRMG